MSPVQNKRSIYYNMRINSQNGHLFHNELISVWDAAWIWIYIEFIAGTSECVSLMVQVWTWCDVSFGVLVLSFCIYTVKHFNMMCGPTCRGMLITSTAAAHTPTEHVQTTCAALHTTLKHTHTHVDRMRFKLLHIPPPSSPPPLCWF